MFVLVLRFRCIDGISCRERPRHFPDGETHIFFISGISPPYTRQSPVDIDRMVANETQYGKQFCYSIVIYLHPGR